MAKKGGLAAKLLPTGGASRPTWAGFQSVAEEQGQAERMAALAGTAADAGQGGVEELPVALLDPNPFQARVEFGGLEELAASMRQHGFFGTLGVRPHPGVPGRYQIIYGERRLRAARQVPLAALPCVVRPYSDAQMLEIGLAENVQRQDLNPLELAYALQTFKAERGYSLRQLAAAMGKSKSYVDEMLGLLDAPEDVQAMIRERPDTVRAARDIAQVGDVRQRAALIRGLLEGPLGGRDVARAVQEAKRRSPGPAQGEGATGVHHQATLLQQRAQIARGHKQITTILQGWQTIAPDLDPESAQALHAALEELQQLAVACEAALR